ncbi:MAG: O-antigen ligase family protein [Patescibacteria group bacterium]
MLKVLFLFAVYSLSFGQLANISRLPGLNIYAFDFFVGLFAFVGCVYFFTKRTFRLSSFLNGYLIFILIALLSLMINFHRFEPSQILVAGFYLVRFILYCLAGVVLYNLLRTKYFNLVFVYKSLIGSCFFVVLLGFIQLLILPDFTVLDSSLGWDPHKFRLASTFFDPNFVGGYIVFHVALVFHLLFNFTKFRHLTVFSKKTLLLFLLIFLLAIFLTFSRSAWLFLAVVIFVFGMYKSKVLFLMSLLLAFSAYFAVPRVQTRLSGITDPADSASFRLISWQNTLTIAKDNLITGVGFNTFRYVQDDYGYFGVSSFGGNSGAGSDSSFLLVLATTGIFGFVIFLLSYLYPVYSQFFSFAETKPFFISVSIGLFLQSQFINAFFYPQIMFLYFLTLGLLGRKE